MTITYKKAQNQKDFADVHGLTVSMCQEMGYPHMPQQSDLVNLLQRESASIAVFLAYSGATPIGQVMLTRELDPYLAKPFGIMKSLYVLPEYRNRVAKQSAGSVAQKLLEHVMEEAKARQYGALQWYVYCANKPSLQFFARSGYHPKQQDDFVEFWQPLE